MNKRSKAVKRNCKNPRKRKHTAPRTQERKFRVCGSAGKRIGNIGVWGKLCVFYSEKNKRG